MAPSLVNPLGPLIFSIEYQSPWCPDSCWISGTQNITHPYQGELKEEQQLVACCVFIYIAGFSYAFNRCQGRVISRCEQSNQYARFLYFIVINWDSATGRKCGPSREADLIVHECLVCFSVHIFDNTCAVHLGLSYSAAGGKPNFISCYRNAPFTSLAPKYKCFMFLLLTIGPVSPLPAEGKVQSFVRQQNERCLVGSCFSYIYFWGALLTKITIAVLSENKFCCCKSKYHVNC